MTIGKNTYIHPTAVIFENVEIGDDCYIGPFCIIGGPPEHADCDPLTFKDAGVCIEYGVRLYGHNTIDAGIEHTTVIENRCILMKGAHVGHDAYICENVTLSCGVRVGGHSEILNWSNIGLNAVLHQFTELPEGTMVGASAFVKGKKFEPWSILAGVPAKVIGKNVRGMEKWGVSQ